MKKDDLEIPTVKSPNANIPSLVVPKDKEESSDEKETNLEDTNLELLESFESKLEARVKELETNQILILQKLKRLTKKVSYR